MGNNDYLDDGYVAALLAQDAKNSSRLNSLSSNAPKPAHKPKPNTRFLRNIIKDTDSHNAVLLAKEAAESRARLRSLANEDHDVRKEILKKPRSPLDIRKRQLGDIAAILGGRGGGKRKRENEENEILRDGRPEQNRFTASKFVEGGETSTNREKPRERRSRNADRDSSDRSRSPRRHHRHRSHSRERRIHPDDDHKSESKSTTRATRPRKGSLEELRDTGRDDSRRRRRISEDYSEDDDYERDHRRHRSNRRTSQDGRDRGEKRRRRHHSRSRSRSPHEHGHRESRRSKSPRRKRSRSPEARRESNRKSRHSPSPKKSQKASSRIENPSRHQNDEDYDSDPLSSIIGPPPPPIPQVRSRGRGAFSHGAGIDSRFSADYDPTVDVQLDPDEENDWDQALEALRDRQKWKKQGADRLKAAGFTDEEIKKWEKGGEKTEEDVKWAKRGEGREWDRGKILDSNGVVSIEPAFGRLKDA
ncbi:hypothetical protein HYFRA_00005562 [Hymenoscyphus fraxineus]|uniref:Pre-mRNA-splicing factor 38B n=1 Tax=Hymenoscyphus fraxineus TaxID=746836 RepID=A0A9N9KPQ0_9HELO|nr:hypothetical protein HYFRA_00005562 [Hymenoscyphus fraxineus]